ncbi:MAG TPA: GNAT family N-acetyltransferase [Tahibacter sp.]|uniref:GNAT family N-acetyltransferase n=1 Tax=Tahibacter sp. TaxID=2056211 RepID=UPI002B8655FD|nr:GNAT family N-acetyltransferase [Tahibacter sp.]HSX59516.1 GNAT family N-acetyltransferase [Tahibacter sp.]
MSATTPKPLAIVPLAARPQYLPELKHWFETEWADYYGAGGRGDAAADLAAFAGGDGLPFALIAVRGDELCGIAALKRDAFAGLDALFPWASAGLVKPALRGRGIGAALIAGLEDEARRRGYSKIYSATSTAETLLRRRAWRFRESVVHGGAAVAVYEKDL